MPPERVITYMTTTPAFMAMPVSATHGCGQRMSAAASRPWPMPTPAKNAPYSHHARKCGAA